MAYSSLASALVCILLLTLSATTANPEIYERNLAYRSPFVNHEILKRDTHEISARHAREGRHATRAFRKRQEQMPRPADEPNNVGYVGYGLGVAVWDDATYIYAGGLNFTHSIASGTHSNWLLCIAPKWVKEGGG